MNFEALNSLLYGTLLGPNGPSSHAVRPLVYKFSQLTTMLVQSLKTIFYDTKFKVGLHIGLGYIFYLVYGT